MNKPETVAVPIELFYAIQQAFNQIPNKKLYRNDYLDTYSVVSELEKLQRVQAEQTPLHGRVEKDPDYCRCESTSKHYTEWVDGENPPKDCGCAFGQCAKGLIY